MAKKINKDINRPFKSSFIKNGLLVLGILLAGYFSISLILRTITRHSNVYTLADFTGVTIQEAQELAKDGNFRLDITDSLYIRGMERGVICKQNPAPGSKVKKNRRILLTINSVIPKQVTVPDVVNFSLRQAKTELIASGLQLGRLIYIEDIATNNVLAQQYKGRDIEPGTLLDSDSKIDLILGLNPNTDTLTFVPNVIGYKCNIAKDIIYENSLNISNLKFDNTVKSYVDSLEAFVYGQYPEPSDSIGVNIGGDVTLYLSLDQTKIPVPTEEEKEEEVEDEE